MPVLVGGLTWLLIILVVAYFVVKFIKKNSKSWAVENKKDELIAAERAYKKVDVERKKAAASKFKKVKDYLR